MTRRVLTWVVAVLAAGAVPAAAQVPGPAVSVVLDPADGVRAGSPLSVTGVAGAGTQPWRARPSCSRRGRIRSAGPMRRWRTA